MKTDKKDLLRVYSVSKLIFNEIKRLNQKNRDKKVLAKLIIVEIQTLKIQRPHSHIYQLGFSSSNNRERNAQNLMPRFRNNVLNAQQKNN